MSDETSNVTQLPVRFKQPLPDDRVVVRPWEVGKREECRHLNCQYIISEELAEVECGRCGAKLNPMWVLGQLAHSDRRMHEAAERYRDEIKRLNERSRTKCQHCGQMTGISRR